MRTSIGRARLGVLLLVALVVLGTIPGLVAAQSNERAGGVVTVAEGETVSGDLEAVGGTVVIAGTVTGSVEATGGSVIVASTGTVEGELEAAAGSVVVEGTVGGDADVAAGSLLVREGAVVGGTLEVAAGDVRVDGEIGGDLRAAAENVRLGPTASVAGDVEYDAETFSADPDASVGGTVTENDDLDLGVGFPIPGTWGGVGPGVDASIPGWIFSAWSVVMNLALGAAVLLVAPHFVDRITALGTVEAVETGAWGLLTIVAVPVVLVVLLLTIVGIPLSLVGFVLFALVLWLAAVLGAIVVGTWLLSLADEESRWLALAVGVLAVALVGFVPFLGGFVQFVVLLLGLGAFVRALRGQETDGDEAGPVDETGQSAV